jgi:hypothetical protein
VLDTVQHHRSRRADDEQSFDTQDLRSLPAHQAVEADRQRRPLDRCGGADGEGTRMRVVRSIMGMILVLSVIVVARRRAVLRAEPTLHFGQSSRGVSSATGKQRSQIEIHALRVDKQRQTVQRLRRLTSRATSSLPAMSPLVTTSRSAIPARRTDAV